MPGRVLSTHAGALTALLVGLSFGAPMPTHAADTRAPDRFCKREQLCLTCNGPACMQVAAPAAWPDSRLPDGTAPFVLGGHFKVSLPKGATAFVLLADGDLIARYAPDRWVSVQLLTAREANHPEWHGRQGQHSASLAYADVPRIQHTKTPRDTEPSHLDERRIWRFAMMDKGNALKGATTMTTFSRGRSRPTCPMPSWPTTPSWARSFTSACGTVT